jgi:hypothetical protein
MKNKVNGSLHEGGLFQHLIKNRETLLHDVLSFIGIDFNKPNTHYSCYNGEKVMRILCGKFFFVSYILIQKIKTNGKDNLRIRIIQSS